MVAIGRVKLACPFCNKETIEALYFPHSLKASTTRTASKSITKLHAVNERYEIITGCSNCGKSENEVKRAFKEGIKEQFNKEKAKKRLEELKKLGFSGTIRG